jgi:hypothetical protein
MSNPAWDSLRKVEVFTAAASVAPPSLGRAVEMALKEDTMRRRRKVPDTVIWVFRVRRFRIKNIFILMRNKTKMIRSHAFRFWKRKNKNIFSLLFASNSNFK